MKHPRLLSLFYLFLNTCTHSTAYSFAGKRALVTGSSGKVGAAVAKELARRGASVLVHYNTKYEAARQTNQYIIESGGSCDGIVQCDFTKPGDILQMMRIVDQIWGGQLDILVNSAECVTRLAAEDDNDRITAWRKTIQVNLNAPFKLSRLAHQRMKRQPDGGVIVNISSNHQSKNLEYMTAFAASKAGLDRMTAGLSNEWSRDRVRVNAVSPTFSLGSERYLQGTGYGTQQSSQDSWSSSDAAAAKGANGQTTSTTRTKTTTRVATVENIANSVLYLCESEYTTGSVLSVDGSNSRTNMFRPRPLAAATSNSTRPKTNNTASSSADVNRFESARPQNRPGVNGGPYQNAPYQNAPYQIGRNQNGPYQNGQYQNGQYQARIPTGQNGYYPRQRYEPAPHYMSSQRGTRARPTFDTNGTPRKRRMENYRDGSERSGNYQVRSRNAPGAGQRWDTNTLDKRGTMENYRDGTGRESISTYGSALPSNPNTPFATRPAKRKTTTVDGSTFSRTTSVSQNFANGDPRYQNYNNYDGVPPPLYGTRPVPREKVRREMNQISRSLHNGESQLPEYTRYPEPRVPKMMATRPRPDAKYKQVTRHLNGRNPSPLVDPNRSRNPTGYNQNYSPGYNPNQLPAYREDQEPKRYGGTSQPL